jgi:hypothetical protein
VAVGTSTTPEASGSVVTPAAGSGTGLPPGDIFVFLCPNGHKLHGPPSLKGKPGQCPHCGARFLIPTDEDLADASDAQPAADDTLRASERRSADPGIDFDRLLAGSDQAEPPAGHPLAGPAGLGQIVGRLWAHRTPQAELEIYLSEGEILIPDLFAPQLSTSDYGVFAVREGDGRYVVTIVPWAAVRRACLRRMDSLPGDLFTG